MLRFMMVAGPLIIPLAVLAVVVVMLTVANAVRLLGRRSVPADQLRRSIDAVLFWGSVSAVIGFLGQWIGLNKLANIVIDAGVVNPQAVVQGFADSLTTSVVGMGMLVGSAFLWLFLRIAHWSSGRLSETLG